MKTQDKYILKGKKAVPCNDLLEWGNWLVDNIGHLKTFKWKGFCRIVKQTKLNQDILVSTVFLGLDHNFTGQGPPLLFETMVFGGALVQHCERYSTWEEAEKGHEDIVEKIKKGIKPWKEKSLNN